MIHNKKWDKYKDLPPCCDMEIYRPMEKMLSDLCHREIGITTAIDFIYDFINKKYGTKKSSRIPLIY